MLTIRKFLLAIFTCIWCVSSAALAENNLTSQWHKTKYSSSRAHVLMANKTHISLAIEINIIEKYKTYWQVPGSTGVPPIAIISGVNIVENSANIQFPFPHKFINKYGETWGYKDKVVLFVNVDRQQTTKASELNIIFDYAVCDEICLLETAEYSLSLNAGDLAATMSSLKFSKFKKQIPNAISAENSAITNAVLTATNQLQLYLNKPVVGDLFITDSKNRFYQHLSSNNELHVYTAHGLPIDEAYKKSPVTIHYYDGQHYYHTEIDVK